MTMPFLTRRLRVQNTVLTAQNERREYFPVFSVQCFGFRVSSLRFKVQSFGFRVSGFGFRASSFGLRVSGFGFKVQSFEFWVIFLI